MENKYIEAFENIICQKRDNGYISDAYRNDISVVYEALTKLEKLKNEGEEIMQENKNKEYIQKDIELTNKLVKGEKNNMNRLTKKIETKNNGDLAIDNYEVVDNGHIKNDTAFAINKLGRIEDLEEELGCPIEDAFETTEVYEERCKNLEKEQEDTRKNVIEYFKKSEMDSLSMLADIQYLVLNEMDGLKNKWLWKLYFNKIREELQSFHGTEQASDEEDNKDYYKNNQLLLQQQQNKAMEIIFNKCRNNVNLLLVNRNDTYDEYNSAFEYQMRTNAFNLKEEDKLTIDEYIDIYEWLKSERIKNGLETVVQKEVDVTEGE